jgi:hypothetical protein
MLEVRTVTLAFVLSAAIGAGVAAQNTTATTQGAVAHACIHGSHRSRTGRSSDRDRRPPV